MTDFFDKMKQQMLTNEQYNVKYTENGACCFATTGKVLLDLNFKVASLRKAPEEYIRRLFSAALFEEPVNAILWLFYVRDVRGGLGERRLFRICLAELLEKLQTAADDIKKAFLMLIPEYGRFDDLLEVLQISPAYTPIIIDIIKQQLSKDVANYLADKQPISLLAKWLPSENASNKSKRNLAHKLMHGLDMQPKDYRQMLSKLRARLRVTEVAMSANKWDTIIYESVPSRAALIYRESFRRHDLDRYTEFLDKVKSGDAKINAGTLFPHDILAKYADRRYGGKPDAAVEALWQALPNTISDDANTIVVADGSGSMTSSVSGNITALTVANALAIYFAERASGPYKDKYITFSSHPQFVDFSSSKCSGASLFAKYRYALHFDEVANTNIERVFNLILDTAVANNVRQEDLPKNILIISDMEFDRCAISNGGSVDKALFSVISEKYASHGYKLPRLVFWNVASRSGALPMIQNDLGVALVSGFSVNIAKLVLSGELDPYKCLLSAFSTERYAPVKEVISKL